MNSSVPSAAWPEQSASLPGRRSLRVAEARATSLSLRRFSRSSARSMTKASRRAGGLGLGGQPVVEGIAQGALHQPLGVGGGQPLLGLALELRVAHEDADQGAGLGDHVVGGDQRAALLAGQLGIGLQAPGQHRAQARLVRAALGRRHGVAVGAHEAVGLAEAGRPSRPPPIPPRRASPWRSMRPVKGSGVTVRDALRRVSARKSARPLGKWNVASAGVSSLIRSGAQRPADLDAAEQVGLGARHPVAAAPGLNATSSPKITGSGREGDRGAVLAGGAELAAASRSACRARRSGATRSRPSRP